MEQPGIRGLHTPDDYPHGWLLPTTNGDDWVEEISGARLRLWPWLQNILGYFILNLKCKPNYCFTSTFWGVVATSIGNYATQCVPVTKKTA